MPRAAQGLSATNQRAAAAQRQVTGKWSQERRRSWVQVSSKGRVERPRQAPRAKTAALW